MTNTWGAESVRLLTLDPAHFHAALVQKFMYPQVSPVVRVYAPSGPDLQDYVTRIENFNSRAESPTTWEERFYTNSDFLERMTRDKAGNVVIIAGNNTRKTRYIYQSVKAGFNVLADKPMAINPSDFRLLQKAFNRAAAKKVLLFDIMTERFEITTILQRELARTPTVFGRLQLGTAEQPAVEMESMHYFLKEVDGRPLTRPAWFFDVRQEGEAIPDVGTHLIDLVQWECFPDEALNWRKDIKVLSARRWPTKIAPEQFKRVTGVQPFPKFLQRDVTPDGSLNVYGNGEVRYRLRGVHTRVRALWDFEPVAKARDSLHAVLRGTRGNLYIKQTQREQYQPTLYVEQSCDLGSEEYERLLREEVSKLSIRWPGLEVKRAENMWQVVIPTQYSVGHEAHFAQVTDNFLNYLQEGKLPAWEVPCLLAKYFTTTEAYRLSHAAD